jgi:hypothetical protein
VFRSAVVNNIISAFARRLIITYYYPLYLPNMALLYLILAALPVVGWLAYSSLKHARFQQFKNIPRLSPDLIWGHMKLVNEYQIKVGKQRHIGMLVLCEQLSRVTF